MQPEIDFPSDLQALEHEYELIREIGQGGMAAVYLARHRSTAKLVAIKAIRSRYLDDPEALRRFAREARTVADLNHPNIVRTESIEQIGDRAIEIFMEYVPGGTVRDRLREYGAFSAEDAEAVLRDVGSALQYAHRRRIVHRDVKPENVFLDQRTGRALLSDFGIARPIDADGAITMLGAALGTPQYMSPEQIDGRQVDGRSDIYSLGVLGWELLTGRRPWAGENLYGVIYKQKHEALTPITSIRPRVPANLLAAIDRALMKDRDRRWQSIDEFLDHLTYDPPPVLAQAYPTGASSRDDDPTIRFRRVAPDSEPAVERKAPPNAVEPRQRTSAGFGRRTVLRGLGLLVPLAIAIATWYVLLPGRSESSRSEPAGGLTSSTGTVALDTARVAPRDPARETPASPPPPAAKPKSSPQPAPPKRQPIERSDIKRSVSAVNPRCASPAMADQRACLLAHIAHSDTALQRVYDALIAELRRDAGVRRGAPDPSAVTRLRVEQRAWVVARDRECTRQPRPGSVPYWAQPLAECFARVSAQREKELGETLRRARQQARYVNPPINESTAY
jgi:serine/threonine protein kinase